MTALVSSVALACLALGAMNVYQAVTGKRVSKKPSSRSDAVMRRQSAVAGTVLVTLCLLLTAMWGTVLVAQAAGS